MKVLKLEEILNITQNIIDKYIQSMNLFEYTLIHGDLNLSNILFNDDKMEYIFIDPRGYYGSTKIYGSKYYEICKIYFSLIGFDEFNSNENYYFSINDDNINTNIDMQFEKLPIIKNMYSLEEYKFILCLSITIWLGLPYYFKSHISKLIGSHYHSLYIATKYLQQLDNLENSNLVKFL